jgi:hypothetical protein
MLLLSILSVWDAGGKNSCQKDPRMPFIFSELRDQTKCRPEIQVTFSLFIEGTNSPIAATGSTNIPPAEFARELAAPSTPYFNSNKSG